MNIFRPKTTTTTTATSTFTTTTRIPTSLNKRAACFGINDYPGTQNDLNGCLNDATNWQDVLSNIYGFNVALLTNSQCTKGAFKEIVGNYISDSKPGDKIAITYSGHGTSVYDTTLIGDESDGKDEAICLYDGNLIDDDIRSILSKLNPEVSFTFISDSCFSGTVTRAFLSSMREGNEIRPKFLPPQDNVSAAALAAMPVRKRIFFTEDTMKEILISGCKDNEYSYDAFIGGKASGAFTYYATQVVRSNPQLTYNQFYEKLRLSLPNSEYPQTPLLEGNANNKNKILFS